MDHPWHFNFLSSLNCFPRHMHTCICDHDYVRAFVYVLFLIHLSIDEHLGWSHITVITNNVSKNSGAQQITWLKSFISFTNVCPGTALLDHIIFIFLMFWETYILFTVMTVLISIPTSSVQSFSFSASSPVLFIFLNLDNCHSNRLKCYSIVDIICISLIISHDECIFIYLLTICMPCFEKCQSRSSILKLD